MDAGQCKEGIAMKRIQSACIQKTLNFQLKEDLGHVAATGEVKKEVERYKAQLDRSKTRYKILDERTQPTTPSLSR